MLKTTIALGLVATLALGCDTKETPPATPANANPGMTPAMSDAQKQADTMAGDATAKMKDMGGAAKDAAADAGDKATAAGDTMMAQAQTLYDQAKAAIGKADFNGAQAYVDKLSALKSKLSPEWQAKVTEVEKMLADGKSKLGGMTMPKVGQ